MKPIFVPMCALAGSLALALGIPHSQADQAKPNVLLFFADDMGYSDCQYYRPASPDHVIVNLPNMETLASQGMAFSNAYSPASLCQPSRYSVLAGNYPFRGGGAWNFNGGANIRDDQTSLGALMQLGGYRTSMFGKGHIGARVSAEAGGLLQTSSFAKHVYRDMDLSQPLSEGLVSRGFDYSFVAHGGIQDVPYAYFENDMIVTDLADVTGISGPLVSAPFNPAPTWIETAMETWFTGTAEEKDVDFVVWNHTAQANDNGIGDFKGQNFHTSLQSINDGDPQINGAGWGMDYWQSNMVGIHLVETAVKFIDDHHQQNTTNGTDQPFFMHFCAEAVHEPQTPPIDFDYDPNGFDPNNPVTPVEGVTGGSNHMDMLYQLDVQLGELLDALSSRGLLDNTIVIVTSDNGGRSDSEGAPHNHNSNDGITGKKSTPWEGGLRVPMIVRWGDGTLEGSHIAPGTWNHQVVNIIDIYATMAEMLGLSMADDQGMDSASMWPLWMGTHNNPIRDFLLLQDSSAHAIRVGDWKLMVERPSNPDDPATNVYGLYDLTRVPVDPDNTDVGPNFSREIPDITDPDQLPGGKIPLGLPPGATPNNLIDDPLQQTRIADMLALYNLHYKSTDRTTSSLDFSSTPVAPVANDDPDPQTTANVPVDLAVLDNDTDGNSDPLTAIKVTDPAHGWVTQNGNDLTYTPALNYSGPDSFTYKANDGTFDSNVATVTIDVQPAPPTGVKTTVFTDDFNSYTAGANEPELSTGHSQLNTNGWLVTGIPFIRGNGGVDNSQEIAIRRTSTLTLPVDLDAAGFTAGSTVDVSYYAHSDDLESGDTVITRYSKDGGSNWTVLSTYDNSDTTLTQYTDSIDTTGWSTTHLQGFQFGFSGANGQNNDHLRVDNFELCVTSSGPLDTDSDGMPDDWEDANGTNKGVDDAGLDDDKDGQSNLAEYLAGTHPQDPNSVLRGEVTTLDLAGNEITIEWPGRADRAYQIHRSEDLDTWRPVPGVITATPPTNQQAVAVPPGIPRFFLKIEPGIAP